MSEIVEVPEGYELVEDNPPPPSLSGVLAPAVFTEGRLVIFLGRHEVKKDGETYRGFFIAGRNRPSEKRLIWAHAMLERKLEKARAGDVVFLQYHGLAPHRSMPGAQEHVWTVGLPKRPHPQATVDFD